MRDLSSLEKRQLEALRKIEAHDDEYIIGIDEVGIGAFAGPVTIGVVVVPRSWKHRDVKDSKKLSPKAREYVLREYVLPSSVFHMTVSMSNERIDSIGVEEVRKALTESAGCAARIRFPDALIVQDGLEERAVPIDGSTRGIICVPKADALVPAVSAASILAKVTRDAYMKMVDKEYPGYDFASNAGYHSKTHVRNLLAKGPCPLHRQCYAPVKRVMANAARI